MSTSGIRITQSSSASCLLPADASLPKHSTSSRSPLSVEISSHWNCSGRLSCELQKHLNIRCVQDSEQCHQSVYCVHNLKDARRSFRPEEKVPAVFPINLSSRLGGWLAQLFNASVSKEDRSDQDKVTPDSQPGGFESFLLEYEAEKGLDPLQTYIMQPFKGTSCAPFSPRDSDEHLISATALAEVAITDLVSAIPSVDALKTVPYFDMLHSNLTQAPEFSQYLTQGEISSPDCSQKAKRREAQTDHLVTPDQLGSSDALASWLSDRLPSGISQWGTAPGTKRVANLWIELKDGEIVLEDSSPPRRMVQVASVKIKNQAGHMLVEAHQEMADGSIRFRNRPLSEKMRPGENVEEACFRGIFEELGSQLGAKNRVRIVSGSYLRKQEERESLSYPGLLTSYVIHSVDAIVEDLPNTGFYTVEDELNIMEAGAHLHKGAGSSCNGAAIGVKKHFWRWIPQPL